MFLLCGVSLKDAYTISKMSEPLYEWNDKYKDGWIQGRSGRALSEIDCLMLREELNDCFSKVEINELLIHYTKLKITVVESKAWWDRFSEIAENIKEGITLSEKNGEQIVRATFIINYDELFSVLVKMFSSKYNEADMKFVLWVTKRVPLAKQLFDSIEDVVPRKVIYDYIGREGYENLLNHLDWGVQKMDKST